MKPSADQNPSQRLAKANRIRHQERVLYFARGPLFRLVLNKKIIAQFMRFPADSAELKHGTIVFVSNCNYDLHCPATMQRSGAGWNGKESLLLPIIELSGPSAASFSL